MCTPVCRVGSGRGCAGADCDGRYDEGRLCLIYDHDINSTLDGGPFPSGEWSMFTPVSYYAQVSKYCLLRVDRTSSQLLAVSRDLDVHAPPPP